MPPPQGLYPGLDDRAVRFAHPVSTTTDILEQGRGTPRQTFVEFESAAQSGVAMAGLQGFKVTPSHAMALSYARA